MHYECSQFYLLISGKRILIFSFAVVKYHFWHKNDWKIKESSKFWNYCTAKMRTYYINNSCYVVNDESEGREEKENRKSNEHCCQVVRISIEVCNWTVELTQKKWKRIYELRCFCYFFFFSEKKRNKTQHCLAIFRNWEEKYLLTHTRVFQIVNLWFSWK